MMREFARRMVSVLAGVALAATPVLLVLCAQARFGGWSPFHGLGEISGWLWRLIDSLGEPLDIEALVDVLIRCGLIVGWISVVAVGISVPAELRALRQGISFSAGPAARCARVMVSGFLLIAQPVAGAVAASDPVVVSGDEPDGVSSSIDTWTVEPGESVYGIAERLAAGDGSRIFVIADGILEMNLGTVMTDGSVFSNPATIRPGWRLVLPVVEDGLVAVSSPGTHRVVEGDTLSTIAAVQLGDASRWAEIFDLNAEREMSDGRVFKSPELVIPGWDLILPAESDGTQPAEAIAPDLPAHIVDEIEKWRPDVDAVTVPSPVEPPATAVAAPLVESSPAGNLEPGNGRWVELAGVTMLAAGLVGALGSRRRSGLRRARSGQRPRSRAPHMVEVERTVMARAAELGALDRVAAVDLALRSIAPALADQRCRFDWAAVEAGGSVRIGTDQSLRLEAPWELVDAGEWRLSTLPVIEDGVFPFPTLVQVGTTDDGSDVFVDLEMSGGLEVHGVGAEEVVAGLQAALEVSPFAEHCVVIAGDGFEPEPHLLDSHPWEERILLGDPVNPVVHAVGTMLMPNTITETSTPLDLRLESDGSCLLSATGLRVTPLRLSAAEQPAVAELSSEPTFDDDPSGGIGATTVPSPPIMIRVLGEPIIENANGETIEFDRSKSAELVVWLATHRERPTRSRARAALWDSEVRAATFSNVVSDARRSLARSVAPEEGAEWIDRTLTEELCLHPDALTDADVLRAARDLARPLPPASAIGVLRPALELVRGLPFAGTAYLWPDPEGITSELVVLATGAAGDLASWYLALGDLDGVFWATARGLQVLPGHEELIGLRMRARAARGDTAGLRQEWASYERVLADDWSGGEPAPELVELRRELLSARTSTAAIT